MGRPGLASSSELSDLEQNALRVLTGTRYIASNVWLDTKDSGAVFADFFKVLLGLVEKGFVKEWTTEYSALRAIPHGQREFFLSQKGERWKERMLKEERKHGVTA